MNDSHFPNTVGVPVETKDVKPNKTQNDNAKRLHIGLFIDTFFPMIDGVINVVDNYARRLSKNHDVTVFTVRPRTEWSDDELPYKVCRCNRIRLKFLDYDLPAPFLDAHFKSLVENEKLDIVHVHSPFAIGGTGVRYAKRHKIPAVATLHSQYYKDFLRETKSERISKKLLKKVISVFDRCDECWAVNDEVGRIYSEEYGLKKPPITKNNGTDMSPLENSAIEALKFRTDRKINEEQKILLFVGRITDLKNVFFIADSLKILKDRGFNFKMFFVGNGPDEGKLKRKISEAGLNSDVFFEGRITDKLTLEKYYNAADLFLFPSLYDCSSLVQIEAATQGTPTLFLKGAATCATVTDDENGYISENDAEKYAERIIQIFSNPALHEQVSENGKKTLFFSWDEAVKKAERDYLKIIKNFTPPEKINIK